MNSKEKMEKLRKATCEYPGVDEEGNFKCCGKKQMMTISLPLLKLTESGKIEPMQGPEGGTSIVIPFCKDHAFIMMSGHFGVLQKGDKMQLQGPFDMVDLIKSVMSSMIMTKELQEMIKGVDKNDETTNT